MDIFESLENLEVSEACFDKIMDIIETLVNEKMTDPEEYKASANKVIPQRKAEFEKAYQEFKKVHDKIDPERIVNYKLTPIEKYRTNKTATKFERAQDRLMHAQEVAGKIKKTPHGIEIEECFNDILDLIEGVMDDIKAGMSPEKAKQKWVADKNKGYVDAVQKESALRRLKRKANEKFYKGLVKYKTVKSLSNKIDKANNEQQAKFKTQLNANYDTKAGENKMVLPKIGTFGDKEGKTKYFQSGYKKGGKKFTPKK